MRRMEDIVAGSGLNWTIVRPSGLFDLPYVTDYIAGRCDPVGAFTSRTDLADYLLKLAGNTRKRCDRDRFDNSRHSVHVAVAAPRSTQECLNSLSRRTRRRRRNGTAVPV